MSKISRPNLFALKILKKTDVRQKNQVGHVIAERDILSEANNNDWIVKLQGSFQVKFFFKQFAEAMLLLELSCIYFQLYFISDFRFWFSASNSQYHFNNYHNFIHVIKFQDNKNLYFIMEYVPGGDLMEKLIRDEKFDEDLARYVVYY